MSIHIFLKQVVYGDTDSIFVNFKPRHANGQKMSSEEALQASINMSIDVEKGIQNKLEYPHKLEYEKTFFPFILLRKKGILAINMSLIYTSSNKQAWVL